MKIGPLYKQLLTEGFVQDTVQDMTKCAGVQLTPEIAQEARQYESDEQFLRAGGLSWDTLCKAAFGFNEDEITTIKPEQLHIKWKEDLENVKWEVERAGNAIAWAKKVDLSEPIEVIYEHDKFFIDDGHHRYYAAKILKKVLNCVVDIKQNPVAKLDNGLSYDEFHRCVYVKAKSA